MAELARPLPPGTFGENLTIAGMDVSAAVIGERWAVGSAGFEVSQPRTPCGKLGLRMGDDRFPRRFVAAGRPGAYLRIRVEGDVGAGDEIRVEHRPDHGLTVAAVARARSGDGVVLAQLLMAPELAGGWVAWAVDQAAGRLRREPSDDALRAALRWRLVEAGVEGDRVDAALEALVAEDSGPAG